MVRRPPTGYQPSWNWFNTCGRLGFRMITGSRAMFLPWPSRLKAIPYDVAVVIVTRSMQIGSNSLKPAALHWAPSRIDRRYFHSHSAICTRISAFSATLQHLKGAASLIDLRHMWRSFSWWSRSPQVRHIEMFCRAEHVITVWACRIL